MKTRMLIFGILCIILATAMCTKYPTSSPLTPNASSVLVIPPVFADTTIISITSMYKHKDLPVDLEGPLPKIIPGDEWYIVSDTQSVIGTYRVEIDIIIDTSIFTDPVIDRAARAAVRWAWLFSDAHYGPASGDPRVVFDTAFVPPFGVDRIGHPDYTSRGRVYAPGDTLYSGVMICADSTLDSVCIDSIVWPEWTSEDPCTRGYNIGIWRCTDTAEGIYVFPDTVIVVKGQFEYTSPGSPLNFYPGIYEVWFRKVGNELTVIHEAM